MQENTEYLNNKKPLLKQTETVLANLQKGSLGKLFTRSAQGVIGFTAGSAGVFACLSLTHPRPENRTANATTTPPVVTDEPVQAESVNDNMSFAQAFAAARSEVGSSGYFVWHGKVFGTLYDDEAALLTPAEQNTLYNNTMAAYNSSTSSSSASYEPVVVVHDRAPVAESITDDMSFRDAFAVARAEVGPGGCFTWHGKVYNTYTKEEMDNMNPQERQEFFASVGNVNAANTDISYQDVDIVQLDQLETDWSDYSSTGENLIREEYVDDGQGGKIHIAVFDVNGQLVARADMDNDGIFDMEMTADEAGNLQVQDNSGESITLTPGDLEQLERQTGESNITSEPDPGTISRDDFDPNADMSDWQNNQ